jgi:tripartite ATP-independent transporter DctP family solute receptor
MKHRFVCVLSIVIAVGFMSTVGFAAPLVLKLAHEEPETLDSGAQISSLVFKEVIETQSNGAMQVTIYPASSQGNQRERMELLKAGIIQVNIASIGGIAPFYQPINAVDLPFAIPNHAVADEVFDGPFGEKIRQDLLKETGFRFLMLTCGGFYVLTNNVRPIHTVKDMKGLKFRTMAVPSHIALMKSLGAAATPIPWDELYSSLQTGVVQGQHNPIPIIAIGNLQEVQKYATLTNHLYGGDWWLTSESFYQSLSDEQRRIFINAYTAAKVAGRGHTLIASTTEKGPGFLEKAGLEVYSPTSAQLAEFKAKAVPAVMEVIQKDLGDQGTEMANALLQAVKAAENKIYGK